MAILYDAYQHHGYREGESVNPLTRDQNESVRGDTPLIVAQDAYDKYTETDKGASVKASGGNYGGGYRESSDTVGALCARDFKGVGSQYVDEGKCIVSGISQEGAS